MESIKGILRISEEVSYVSYKKQCNGKIKVQGELKSCIISIVQNNSISYEHA